MPEQQLEKLPDKPAEKPQVGQSGKASEKPAAPPPDSPEAYTSYSRLSMWQQCPKKFKFAYVDELPEEATSISLIFGSAIHEATEAYLMSLARAPLAAETVYAIFERAVRDSVGIADDVVHAPVDWDESNLEQTLAKGKALLECFVQQTDKTLQVVGTEVAFDLEVAPGRRVHGYFDAVLKNGEDRLKVVEIKTAASTYGADRLAYDLQPTMYIVAAERLFDAFGKVDFEYWLLMKTKQPAVKVLSVTRTEADKLELIETIDEYKTAIGAKVFPRRRNWACGGCPFAEACIAGEYVESRCGKG